MNEKRLQATWRIALRLLGVGVVAFHGQLLWRRLADGSLADLSVVAHWLISGLLVVGLVLVRRRTGSFFRGREAAVLWILVALLHALTGTSAAPMLATPSSLLALPLGFLVATFLAGLLGRRFSTPRGPATGRAITGFPPLALPGRGGGAGSRAPPR